MKWYWDERGWYVNDEELKDDYEVLKAKGETGCDSFEGYVADCTGSNGTLQRCENMFCRNCIDAIKSRGEKIWTSGKWVDGICDWCEEEDEITEVRFD